MGRLIYLALTSVDGFIGDGGYSWSAPYAEEVLAALTARVETDPAVAEQSPESAAFAATWQAADKVVFSSTLAQVRRVLAILGSIRPSTSPAWLTGAVPALRPALPWLAVASWTPPDGTRTALARVPAGGGPFGVVVAGRGFEPL